MFQRAHLVSILIGLEVVALGVYSCISLLSFSNRISLFLLIMVIRVVEVAILLGLISLISRCYGCEQRNALMVDKR